MKQAEAEKMRDNHVCMDATKMADTSSQTDDSMFCLKTSNSKDPKELIEMVKKRTSVSFCTHEYPVGTTRYEQVLKNHFDDIQKHLEISDELQKWLNIW